MSLSDLCDRVSVVIPTYQGGKTLSAGLASVLAQTHTDLEVVVIDDGSTDGTVGLVEMWAARDARVRLVSQQNAGVSAARNRGIDEAQGAFLTFLDADDWMEPSHLAVMMAAAHRADADVVQTGYVVDFLGVDDKVQRTDARAGTSENVEAGRPPTSPGSDFLNGLGYVWNKLYRLEPLRESGARFVPDQRIFEDLSFNCAVLSGGLRLATVPDALVHYAQRPGRSLGRRGGPEIMEERWRALNDLAALLTHWYDDPGPAHAMLARRATSVVRGEVARAGEEATWTQAANRLRAARSDPAHRSIVAAVRQHGSARQRVEVTVMTIGAPVVLLLQRLRRRGQ